MFSLAKAGASGSSPVVPLASSWCALLLFRKAKTGWGQFLLNLDLGFRYDLFLKFLKYGLGGGRLDVPSFLSLWSLINTFWGHAVSFVYKRAVSPFKVSGNLLLSLWLLLLIAGKEQNQTRQSLFSCHKLLTVIKGLQCLLYGLYHRGFRECQNNEIWLS